MNIRNHMLISVATHPRGAVSLASVADQITTAQGTSESQPTYIRKTQQLSPTLVDLYVRLPLL